MRIKKINFINTINIHDLSAHSFNYSMRINDLKSNDELDFYYIITLKRFFD